MKNSETSLKKLEKQSAARHAVRLLKENQIVGLGSGSTATPAIIAIGELVANGLTIKAVPTSTKTMKLAESLQIPLLQPWEVDQIDITIDGADEFTEDRMLLKGGGGSLLHEKLVASMSKEFVIIADASKFVSTLGKFGLPVEVIPAAVRYVSKQISALGGKPVVRRVEEKPFITDEGNSILDVDFGLIKNPMSLAQALIQITGLVEHGLFVNMATKIVMASGDEIKIY